MNVRVRLRFSLRSLLLATTAVAAALAVWLSRERTATARRLEFLQQAKARGADVCSAWCRPKSLGQRLFGDEPIWDITLPESDFNESDVSRAKQLFPEAIVDLEPTFYERDVMTDEPIFPLVPIKRR